MKLVQAAQYIAIQAHAGQINKHDGEIYLLHVARVAHNIETAMERDPDISDRYIAAAWLHDVPEDTDWSYDRILAELKILCGIDVPTWKLNDVIQAVSCLTKQKGMSNQAYYELVKSNDIARFVKLRGDIVDNFRRNHQITDPATRDRMLQKYSLGTDILS